MAKIKGTALLTSCELMLETHGETGLQQALEMLDEQDRIDIKDAIASGWYDLDLYCRWLKATVVVTCDGDESRLTERAARGISKQLKGIYKVFALFSSPLSVVQRLVAINQTYFQGISTTVTSVSRGRHTLSYDGFEPSHRLFEYILLGWWHQILATTRAKNPTVKLQRSLASGQKCEIAVSWDE
jgi:hypothetical protein